MDICVQLKILTFMTNYLLHLISNFYNNYAIVYIFINLICTTLIQQKPLCYRNNNSYHYSNICSIFSITFIHRIEAYNIIRASHRQSASIYKTEVSGALTIFHVTTIFFFFLYATSFFFGLQSQLEHVFVSLSS